MNEKQLKIANINNLIQLWNLMGSQTCLLEKTFQLSNSWPNRCWRDSALFTREDISAVSHCLKQMNGNWIIPVQIELEEAIGELYGVKMAFQQTAMYLNLENDANADLTHLTDLTNLKMETIHSEQAIQIWTNIASLAFQYEIEQEVIQKAAMDANVALLMAYIKENPVATAMLVNSNSVIGVHQLGVLPEYQGQGIANKFMQHIIWLCIQSSAKYITLQASPVGQSLYRRLGFKPQFKIININL